MTIGHHTRKFLFAFMGTLLAAFATAANARPLQWEPYFRFPGTFFPAFTIAAAEMEKAPATNGTWTGYLSSGSIGVRVANAAPGARLKVMVAIPEIGVHGEIEVTAPQDGQVRTILPQVSWSTSKLLAITQPLTAEALFRLYVNGVVVGDTRAQVRIRAINDAPLEVCLTSLPCSDYSPIFTAFVNENHPVIDRVLRATLDIPAMKVRAWTGTQGSEEDVLRQVWAIWYQFQRARITYSSIATVSDVRTDIHSQTVRPISQSLGNAQANCIDGTVMFASILRKIGIEPILVLVPGHAFLGFFTAPNRQKPVFLETTMLNSRSNPFYERPLTKDDVETSRAQGVDPNSEQSWRSFQQALEQGQRNYDKASEGFATKQRGFRRIIVRTARELGIQPIGL